MTSPSPESQVTLLDELARPAGAMPKLAAHAPPGHRHLAFSVLLADPDGRVLLQRRATTKYHFAGLWANTCCSHPRPGQPLLDAARQRLYDELGLRDRAALAVHGAFWYRATDVASGLVEHEYDVVIRGTIDPRVRMDLNPNEVAEVAWYEPTDAGDLAVDPSRGAPWLAPVLDVANRPSSYVADDLIQGRIVAGVACDGARGRRAAS